MSGEVLGMFVRLVFSLGVVIGLMWLAAHMLKRRGIGPTNRRPGAGVQVELLARRTMARNASIAVVRVGDRSMVVGITDHFITKLDEANIQEVVDIQDAGTTRTVPAGDGSSPKVTPGNPWKTMLDQLRDKTAR
jgi:flagellar protein FliO/FliZ